MAKKNDGTVFEKVRSIIRDQLGVEEEKITLESNILEDFSADSLDQVELVMCFEEEFDVEIPDEVAEKMITVGDIVKHIEENL